MSNQKLRDLLKEAALIIEELQYRAECHDGEKMISAIHDALFELDCEFNQATTLGELDTLETSSLLHGIKNTLNPEIIKAIDTRRREIVGKPKPRVVGSQWDAWFTAGQEYARANPKATGTELSLASIQYARRSKAIHKESIKRAFLEGAFSA